MMRIVLNLLKSLGKVKNISEFGICGYCLMGNQMEKGIFIFWKEWKGYGTKYLKSSKRCMRKAAYEINRGK